MIRMAVDRTPAKRVLVTGIGGPAGRGIAVGLAQRGYQVVGVDMAEIADPPAFFHQVPPADHSEYPNRLLDLALAHSVTWLVPTVAEELVVLAHAACDFRKRSIAVFMPDALATEACCDKWQTAASLNRLKLRVPPTVFGAPSDPDVEALGFPRLSKPRFGRGGRGVVVHDGPGSAPAQTLSIWQKFLSGTEYDVIVVRRPDEAGVAATCVLEKTALRDGRVGNASAVRRSDNREVMRLALAAVVGLDLWGPIDLDIRCDDAGTPHLLEINARVGAHILQSDCAIDALVGLHLDGMLG